MNIEVLLSERDSLWHARLEFTDLMGKGTTPDEAIGNLIRIHQEALKIQITAQSPFPSTQK